MRGVSDDMSGPDIQRFDSDGTWVKPPGAVRLAMSLKGGTSGGSADRGPVAWRFTGGGGGISPNIAGAGGVVAVDMGTVARAPEWNVTPGEDGQLVECSFAADEVPDRMDIKIGRGGYAVITTHVEG